jgi:hypothetical protein
MPTWSCACANQPFPGSGMPRPCFADLSSLNDCEPSCLSSRDHAIQLAERRELPAAHMPVAISKALASAPVLWDMRHMLTACARRIRGSSAVQVG